MANIPKTPRSNCYFGCNPEGPLHHFPKPERDIERFEIWKAVLEDVIIEKGNMYIYNQLRFCNKHFENYYISPSNRLTRNAIPTLYIMKDNISISASTSTEKSIETFTPVLIDQASKKSIKRKFVKDSTNQGNHMKVIERLRQRVLKLDLKFKMQKKKSILL